MSSEEIKTNGNGLFIEKYRQWIQNQLHDKNQSKIPIQNLADDPVDQNYETLMTPVQCQENPEGLNGRVLYCIENMIPIQWKENPEGDNEDEFRQNLVDDPVDQNYETLTIPVQCQENPEGLNGIVVYENRSYRMDPENVIMVDTGETLRVSVQENQRVPYEFIDFNNFIDNIEPLVENGTEDEQVDEDFLINMQNLNDYII